MRRAFLAGLMAFALASCATEGASGVSRQFTGVWDWHFETSSFTSNTGQGPYWLVAEGNTQEQLSAPLREAGGPWGRVAIVVEGTLSGSGRYGHMGAYARELHVTRVIEARLISAERQPSGS